MPAWRAKLKQMADMKKLHPTLVVTVPQVWEVGRQVAKDVALQYSHHQEALLRRFQAEGL